MLCQRFALELPRRKGALVFAVVLTTAGWEPTLLRISAHSCDQRLSLAVAAYASTKNSHVLSHQRSAGKSVIRCDILLTSVATTLMSRVDPTAEISVKG